MFLELPANFEKGLAISGGVDSMALASLCSHDSSVFNSGSRKKPEFIAFIVNHKLRANSGIEAMRVAAELAKLNIESEILELDWARYGDPTTLKHLEATARRARYQALGRACARRDINTLLVAHHLNDQAETVMGRVLTNQFGLGLAGIRTSAPIPECAGIYGVDHSGLERNHEREIWGHKRIRIEHGGVKVSRPLLRMRKEYLIKICQGSGVRWFEDHTNADRELTLRNTVRFLQSSDVLPVALRTERLQQMAEQVRHHRTRQESIMNQLFNETKVALDCRIGVARFTIPQRLPQNVAELSIRALLLRRMLEVVAPRDTISLPDLHWAVEFVFHTETLDKADQYGVTAEKIQVAATSIQRSTSVIGTEKEAGMGFIFSRAVPTALEKRQPPLKLWPDSSTSQNGHQNGMPDWQLWDSRYWIRVSAPKADSPNYTEIVVRFLEEDDIAALRKSIDADLRERQRFERTLDLAKGTLRFTLPAIVAKRIPEFGHDCSTIDGVVALPSLNWSIPGWEQESKESNNNLWRWDIRYKHVKLSAQQHYHSSNA